MTSSKQDGDEAPKKVSVGAATVAGLKGVVMPVAQLVEAIGAHTIMAARALSWLVRPPFRWGNYIEALEFIGFGSLPIILLVGLFTGMVTALQSVVAMRAVGVETMAGAAAALALAWELAPVLSALMLCGRAGAGIATEIGTMRISEQIDALESMAVEPVQFLVLPRIVAGTIMAPALSLVFLIVGMGGAYLVAVVNQGVDAGQFWFHAQDFLRPVHVVHGLIKASVFGFAVVLIGCYQGFNAKGGGRGVGLGTTRAVVVGSVSILVLDYFVQELLLVLIPLGGDM